MHFFNYVLYYVNTTGEMVEWSKAQHWKCCEGATSPRVRIPLSPPFFLLKKWRTKTQVFSSRFCANKSSSLKTEGFLHIFTELQRRLTCEDVSFC